MSNEKIIEMESGKMYFISYGGSSELVGRYKESTTTDHLFFSHLHYWNGYENYHTGGYCVKLGIEQIREATQVEKHSLFRHEIEKGDI